MDWQNEIDDFFKKMNKDLKNNEKSLADNDKVANGFLENTIVPATESLKKRLVKHDRQLSRSIVNRTADIQVIHRGKVEFRCKIEIRIDHRAATAIIYDVNVDGSAKKGYNARHPLGKESLGDISQINQGAIIEEIWELYKNKMTSAK